MDGDFTANYNPDYNSMCDSTKPLLIRSTRMKHTQTQSRFIRLLEGVVPRADDDTNKVWAFTILGRIVNHLGMWGQGIFALLLYETLVNPKNISDETARFLAYAGGAVVGYGAFKGKDLLVWFFGERNYKKLGKEKCYKILLDLFAFWHWRWDSNGKSKESFLGEARDHLFGIIKRVLIINTGVGFGLLNIVSFSKKLGAGKFASELNLPKLATVFDNHGFQAPFIASSAVSNFVSGPPIHEYGAQSLFSIIKDYFNIFRDISYQDNEKTRAVLREFTFVVNAICKLGNSPSGDDANKLLALDEKLALIMNKLHLHDGSFEVNKSVATYSFQHKEIIKTYDYLKEMNEIKKPAGFLQKAFSWLIGASSTALACYGLQNFLHMPQVILSVLIENPESYTHITTPLGAAWFVSMILLSCASVYAPVKNTVSKYIFNNGDPELNYTGLGRRCWNYFFACALCFVGSTPNIFQLLLSTNANSTTTLDKLNIGAAGAASFLVEIFGVLALGELMERNKALEKARNFTNKNDVLLLMADKTVTLFDISKQSIEEPELYSTQIYLINEIKGLWSKYNSTPSNSEPTSPQTEEIILSTEELALSTQELARSLDF